MANENLKAFGWRESAPALSCEKGSPFKIIDENYREIKKGRGYFDADNPDAHFNIAGFISPRNAALLASAQEMLTSLQRICAEAESWHSVHGHGPNSTHCDAICQLIPEMQRTIRHATGGVA